MKNRKIPRFLEINKYFLKEYENKPLLPEEAVTGLSAPKLKAKLTYENLDIQFGSNPSPSKPETKDISPYDIRMKPLADLNSKGDIDTAVMKSLGITNDISNRRKTKSAKKKANEEDEVPESSKVKKKRKKSRSRSRSVSSGRDKSTKPSTKGKRSDSPKMKIKDEMNKSRSKTPVKKSLKVIESKSKQTSVTPVKKKSSVRKASKSKSKTPLKKKSTSKSKTKSKSVIKKKLKSKSKKKGKSKSKSKSKSASKEKHDDSKLLETKSILKKPSITPSATEDGKKVEKPASNPNHEKSVERVRFADVVQLDKSPLTKKPTETINNKISNFNEEALKNDDDISRKPYVNPQKNKIDAIYDKLEAKIFEEVPEALQGKERDSWIEERRKVVREEREEAHMPEYKSIVRRLYSLKNLPRTFEGEEEKEKKPKTDMNRLMRVNFDYTEEGYNHKSR